MRVVSQIKLSQPTALYLFRTIAEGADPQSPGPEDFRAKRSDGVAQADAEAAKDAEDATAKDPAAKDPAAAVAAAAAAAMGIVPEAEEAAASAAVVAAKEGPQASREVYWVGTARKPTLCGLGRNVLCSWDHPVTKGGRAGWLRCSSCCFCCCFGCCSFPLLHPIFYLS